LQGFDDLLFGKTALLHFEILLLLILKENLYTPLALNFGRLSVPPKRTVLRNSERLEALRSVITLKNFKNNWSYQIARAVVETLIQTGLRNTELCDLKLNNVDLVNQRLNIYLGKGRKNRKVGIPAGVIPILQEYLAYRLQRPVESPYFFLNF